MRVKPILLFGSLLAFCPAFTFQVNAQQSLAQTSLDDWEDIFSDVDSVGENDAQTDEPIDASERPKPPNLNLPENIEEVPIVFEQTVSPEIHAWTRWLLLKNLPPVYENNKKWGKTKEAYDGFRFRREGLKIETYRKWKTVKQGTWSRYFIEFEDPENLLELKIDGLQQISDSKFAFRVGVAVPLHVFGRVAQWQRDVQLISISTNADATVDLAVDCECEVRVIPLTFPPEVQFRPRATAASVSLREFEVHRISQIHGPLAEHLGKGLRHVLDKKLENYNDKLVEKINRQLIKQEDKLQIKLHDRISELFSTASAQTAP